MAATSAFLQYAAAGAAIFCGLAHIYGFIWRPSGDRPMHVASLMFTGMALFAFAVIIPAAISETSAFAVFCATVFLIASVGCQTYCAFRWKNERRPAEPMTGPITLRMVPDRQRRAA